MVMLNLKLNVKNRNYPLEVKSTYFWILSENKKTLS